MSTTITGGCHKYATHHVGIIDFAWTSSAAGAATEVSPQMGGLLYRVVTVPGTGGSVPTTLYDITITDAHGLDVLAGAGVNRSATAAELVVLPVIPTVYGGVLTVNVTNAGDTKTGHVYLYFV
jgi:hypothetical protein